MFFAITNFAIATSDLIQLTCNKGLENGCFAHTSTASQISTTVCSLGNLFSQTLNTRFIQNPHIIIQALK